MSAAAAAAAAGDQSMSNERTGDLQEIDCKPRPLSLVQVLITAVPEDPGVARLEVFGPV